MGRVICISNQKGGVGKTTTAINLAASFSSAQKKTLIIDMDPQGNAGSGLGLKRDQLHGTIYDALIDGRPMRELVHTTELRYLNIIPSNPDLTGAEIELVNQEQRETRLRAALEDTEFRNEYDYILIDSPPSLGLLTLNALTAADSVLIPLQAEYYALEGLSQLTHTIDLVKQALNPNLVLEGILITMFDGRANIAHHVEEEVRGHFEGKVFTAVVPRNVRLAECPSFGKPIILYDIKSKGCTSYLALSNEIMKRDKKSKGKNTDNRAA